MVDEHKKDSGCNVYGVDIHETVTPLMARDALIKCFEAAHVEELDDLKNYGKMSEQELDKMKHFSVETLIKGLFAESKDDFSAPTKESLQKAVGKLASFAQQFRNQEIVKKHYEEMMKIMEKVQ